MGPSGSGKSTLLNLMGGLDTPSFGDDFVIFISESEKLYGETTVGILSIFLTNRRKITCGSSKT